jgi:predicted O-methyltransferase YrrM
VANEVRSNKTRTTRNKKPHGCSPLNPATYLTIKGRRNRWLITHQNGVGVRPIDAIVIDASAREVYDARVLQLPRRLLSRFRKLRPELPTREIIAPLGEPFVSVLCSMYDCEPQLGADGKSYPVDSKAAVPPRQGMLIYNLVCDTKPENTLEIGLAFGFSTVYFLAALKKNGKGHCYALDPYQVCNWYSIGLMREKVVNAPAGTLVFSNEDSIQGLARFAREQRHFGVIFIDGYHRFDDVLIDFSLASLVCEMGGHIILDDLWMPSIQRVVAFIRRNRADFIEVPTPISNVAVFRKTNADNRPWHHFEAF